MEARRQAALRRYHPDLRTGIIVKNFLPDLHQDAGGFLTDVEFSIVGGRSGQVDKVDELIKILLTKDDKHFDAFCRVLSKQGYRTWSDRLRQAAGSGGDECRPDTVTTCTSGESDLTPSSTREPNPNPLLDKQPTEPQLLKVTRRILPRWEDVCVYLDIPSQAIYEAKQNNINNVNQACFAALLWWRNGNSQREVTWRALLEAMREADCIIQADEVEEKVCSQQHI